MTNEMTVSAKQERSNAEQLIVKTEGLKITNKETLDISVEHIKSIKGSYKFLDEKRKKATKPIDESKKEIMSWFKPILTALKNRETELKAANIKYLESRKTDVKMEGADAREYWYAEVIDKKKIPLEWLEPKMRELNELATATKGKSPIAGIIFKTRTVIASVSK